MSTMCPAGAGATAGNEPVLSLPTQSPILRREKTVMEYQVYPVARTALEGCVGWELTSRQLTLGVGGEAAQVSR